MKVLVACEESQRVCIAFRKRGHEAYSCDVQECSGGHPEWHIMGDVLPLINGNCEFNDMGGEKHRVEGKWDLIIAHPPCTYLTVTGNKYFVEEKYGESARERKKKREEAIEFFMKFINADCDRIAVENPIGFISTRCGRPTQIVEPYWFGEHARKATCLWLKGLPKLVPTKMVDPGEITEIGQSKGASADMARDENGKIIAWNDPRTAKIRSKTFVGFAEAMAEQWGELEFNWVY